MVARTPPGVPPADERPGTPVTEDHDARGPVWRRRAVRALRRARGRRPGASPVPALLDTLLRTSAGGVSTDRLTLVLRSLTAAGLAQHCTLATWDSDVAADPASQQVWSSTAGATGAAPLGPPAAGDVVVRDGSETLGYLRVQPPGSGDDARLRTVADALALPLAQDLQARRTARLRRQATSARAELADRRRRAAADMDQTRRSLERDLHDGAQGDLVALRMRLALREISGDPPPGVTLPTTRHLLAEARQVEDQLSRAAAGLAPPELLRAGLPAALRSELPGSGVGRLDLECSPELEGRRYPSEVEAAIFFLCAEAVVNARKHAPGADVEVRLSPSYRGLELTVSDTGPGFDGPAPPGAFRAMRERAASASGELHVLSSSSHGTRVTASIPC